MIKYCTRCVMPDTKPDLLLDEEGVCSACRNYENRKEVDWDARKAYVKPVMASYYTEAITELRVRLLSVEDAEVSGPGTGWGYAELLRTVPGFKKIRFQTHENIGRVSTDASGTSYMPALIVPVPIIARVQMQACGGMANQLKQFFVSTG